MGRILSVRLFITEMILCISSHNAGFDQMVYRIHTAERQINQLHKLFQIILLVANPLSLKVTHELKNNIEPLKWLIDWCSER